MLQETTKMTFIVPTRNNAVAVPDVTPGMHAQQQAMGGQQNPTNPIAYAASLFNRSSRGAGTIDWNTTTSNAYQDPYLTELAEAAKMGGNNAELLIKNKVCQAIEFYTRSLGSKQGILYDVHYHTIQMFRVDKHTRQECPVHKQFIDTITRNPHHMVTIIRNSAAFFGYSLVETVRKSMSMDSEGSPYNQNNLSHATETATRTVLFLEMINWLDKSKAGRELSYSLPFSITEALKKLESIREYSNKVFTYFETVSPYIDISLSKPDVNAFGIVNPALVDHPLEEPDNFYRLPVNEVNQWMIDEARRYAKPSDVYTPPSPTNDNDDITWGIKSNEHDLSRITRKNISYYKFTKYFKPVPGFTNTYIIDPTQWSYIERLYTDQPIGVWAGTFVIVETDLDALNRGGMVECKAELFNLPGGLTMSEAMTDPSKVLPVLKADSDGMVVVDVPEDTALKAVKDKESFEVLPELSEVEAKQKLALVSTKDKIHSAEVSKILEEAEVITKALTGNKVNTASVVVVEGKTNFTMNNPEETKYIKETYSQLFMGKTKPKELTWVKLIKMLIALTNDRNVSKGTADFITMCTTNQINSVLSGSYGFDLDPKEDNFLKLDNIVNDFEDFVEYAREHSTQLFEDMHDTANNLLLANSFVLIMETLVNQHSMPPSTILRQRSLYVGREFALYSINSSIKPVFTSGTKTNVARSFFPALFTTLDKVTNLNKGILLRFNHDDKLWLAQRSALTPDFMTLRVLKSDSLLAWSDFA